MENTTDPENIPVSKPKYPTIRRILSQTFRILLLFSITTAYVLGYQALCHQGLLITFGLYGAAMLLHLLMQGIFANLEIRRIEKRDGVCSFKKTVALTITGYQENPDYLRQCLESCKGMKYPKDKLKIILVIDGNNEEDVYMMEIFKEVFHGEDVGTYVWQENYHTWNIPSEESEDSSSEISSFPWKNEGIQMVEELVRTKRCVCIMQQWGGKREVMYTAFRALGTSVDFILVCNSDIKLDKMATVELVKVLEDDDKNGAVGGDVRVWNRRDSFISFMSSLRYWMVFNMEIACQSYFDSVTYIRGSLGMYRNDILQAFLEFWYNKTFLGTRCPIGDDRFLTNRVLSMGYRTKYSHKSCAYAPCQYLRWLNQQTPWARSYFRMWFCNAQWWHQHHIWMTYESATGIFFPFFVTAVLIRLMYSSSLCNIVWLFLCIQIMSLLVSLYASWQSKKLSMVLMSLYSTLYIIWLLPCQLVALLTIAKSDWGTSGRKKVVNNYVPLFSLSIWAAVLLGGLCYSMYVGCRKDWSKPQANRELYHLLYGCAGYMAYWVLMTVIYCVSGSCCKMRSQAVPQTHDITSLSVSLLV
nr:hyaluronan synthase related sequence protein [Xenopus laevis]